LKGFIKKLDDANVMVVFELEAQGHIPTIEAILNDYTWEKIAKRIG
jgi:acylphosphatase